MSDSLQYDTTGILTPRSMILREYWLPAAWYFGNTDSPQYDTTGIWLPAVWYYVNTDSPQYDTLKILNNSAQAGSNDEKNWRLKISLKCPFIPYLQQPNFVPLFLIEQSIGSWNYFCLVH